MPILVGDYVLLTYGTGIVMGVPAHDERDFIFAKKYGLPIRVVVAPSGWDGEELEEAYIPAGTQVNSAQFDGMSSTKACSASPSTLKRMAGERGRCNIVSAIG